MTQTTNNNASPERATLLIKRAEVAQLLGLAASTVWKLTCEAREGRGDFPQPQRFGARCTRWNRAQVERWAAQRFAQNEGGAHA